MCFDDRFFILLFDNNFNLLNLAKKPALKVSPAPTVSITLTF